MSTNKSFSTETSERYGLALFELSNESSELNIVEKNVNDLLQVYRSNDNLEYFIKNPTEKIQDKLKVISKISDTMNLTKILKNFLSILITKQRIFFLDKILNSFLKLCAKKRGELNASLVSSKNLSNEELKSISNELSKAIGSTINLSYKVDEELIGGLKIQLGSLMIDSSIKNKLKKYEKLMLEN
ncbi:ATP synthase F1 subunit delta [Pelagibacteraceae bacterium]|nr:ATP synthase F1 subunit delta [Pelagibacteraceae bacterium]